MLVHLTMQARRCHLILFIYFMVKPFLNMSSGLRSYYTTSNRTLALLQFLIRLHSYCLTFKVYSNTDNRDARISCELSVIQTDSGIFHYMYLYLYPARDIFTICICICIRPAKCLQIQISKKNKF